MSSIAKKKSCWESLKEKICPVPLPEPSPRPHPIQDPVSVPQPLPETRITEIEERFLSKITKPERLKNWKDYFRVSGIKNIQQLMIAWNNSKTSPIGKRCNEAELFILSQIHAEFNSIIRTLVWQQQMLPLRNLNEFKQQKIKNVLVIGITGQGKTTFINSYANYVNSVSFESQIRYKVIDDELRNKNGESVTNTVTSFPIPRGDYVFNFIDTPGLADTRGLERDQQIIESISNYLIKDLHDQGQILNQVIIVSQSSTDYLIRNRSPTLLQLAMLSVLKLFGRNMSSFTMHALTFSDFTAGSVDNFESQESLFHRLSEQQRINETTLKTQQTSLQQTPLQQQTLFSSQGSSETQQLLNSEEFNGGLKYCQLQNSVFFTKSCGQIQNIQLRKNYENYDRLSQKIEKSEGFSLEETITVINERKRIKQTIDALNDVLRLRVQIERIITTNLNRIRHFEQRMSDNQDFKYIEYKPEKFRVEVDCMVTNCQQCELSCHYDCRVERLHTCTMMVRLGNGDIICDSCQHKVESHRNERFKYQIRLIEEEHTYEDLKKEFENAKSEADIYKQKREKEFERQKQNDAAITEILANMRQSFNTLYSSALYQLDLQGGSLKAYIYRFFKEYDKQLEKYFENDLNSTALLHQSTNMFQTALLQQTTLQRIKTENFQKLD